MLGEFHSTAGIWVTGLIEGFIGPLHGFINSLQQPGGFINNKFLVLLEKITTDLILLYISPSNSMYKPVSKSLLIKEEPFKKSSTDLFDGK